MGKLSRRIESLMRTVCLGFSAVGALALMGMMFLVVTDVFLRFTFNHPILGSYEVVEYLMVLVVFLSLAYGQLNKAHVNVEIITQYLSGGARTFAELVTTIISLYIFILLTWGGILQVKHVRATHQVSQALAIPHWPFQIVVVIGGVLFCLVLLHDIVRDLEQAFKKKS
ncbi:TRAP transporter small permease [Neomoorella humiferrea]|uniref:TRAP transporter small permease n=1 Tax=Neomoorella humiferrea TaxID=676965 RepID=UPI0030D42259